MTELPDGVRGGAPSEPAPASTASPPAEPAAPVPAPAAPIVPPPIDPTALAAGLATRSGSWFAGLDPHGWRTTIVAAALMIGVVFGANIVNAAVPLPTDPGTVDPGPQLPVGPTPGPGESEPPAQPVPSPNAPGPVQPGTGVEIGSGVVVYPAAGWTVVGSEPGQTVLQKAGTILIVGAVPWTDTPLALATAYRDAFFAGEELTANEPEPGEIGSGIPAVAFAYSGVLQGTQVDGAMFVGATGQTGIVFNVFGASGTLRSVSDDLDSILATVQVAGDQG